jgi:hypothetical protein
MNPSRIASRSWPSPTSIAWGYRRALTKIPSQSAELKGQGPRDVLVHLQLKIRGNDCRSDRDCSCYIEVHDCAALSALNCDASKNAVARSVAQGTGWRKVESVVFGGDNRHVGDALADCLSRQQHEQ